LYCVFTKITSFSRYCVVISGEASCVNAKQAFIILPKVQYFNCLLHFFGSAHDATPHQWLDALTKIAFPFWENMWQQNRNYGLILPGKKQLNVFENACWNELHQPSTALCPVNPLLQ